MAEILEDILADFGDGINSDPPPLKLQRTQLAFATNCTVRGQYVRPRPPYNHIPLTGDAWELANTGLFQAACYYKPDAGTEFLVIAVSGNLYKVELDGTVTQVNDANTMQDPTVPQHWMWQAEKWLIWNDGISLPVFFDGTSTRRSGGSPVNQYTTNVTADFTAPPYAPANNTVTIEVTSTDHMNFGDYLFFNGLFLRGVGVLDATHVQVSNVSSGPVAGGVPAGQVVPAGTLVNWQGRAYTGTLSQNLTIPNPTAIGDTFTINLGSNYTGIVGDIIQLGGPALNYQFEVTVIGANQVTAESVNVVIPSANTPSANVLATGTSVATLTGVGNPYELPAGKMGAYGMGRNVMALPDGKRFVESDIVGGSSGTLAENYRNSVLNITENSYLSGGGFFTIPGGVGDIRAIKFTATLDVSLGQGPCQIFTPTHVFSVNVPVDRTTWADLTNPILTESLITNGGLSQNGTINANGDLIFRSVDGIRSLILARRDFATWGNVPMSTEMDRVLAEDQAILLGFCSAIVFDNRLLMTAGPHASDQGIYHDQLIALNFDPVSSLRGKAPSVYDGVWNGLNVLQLVEGMFTAEQRAFAFTRNSETEEIELHELMASNSEMIYDNGTDPIQWSFETAAIFKEGYYSRHDLLKLLDGEISVDLLEGLANFEVWVRPDQYPCYSLWHRWDQCAQTAKAPLPIPENADTLQLQFRPRMGLGTPSLPCDPSTNRTLSLGYFHQLKFVFTGSFRFMGGRFRASKEPQPKFAPPICCP